jgi:hypothetical protein
VNSKKEVLAASILAISLAIGLGTISYALFTGGPTTAKPALDAFTQKGGQGASASGGNFEPLDSVSIYAHLTQGDKNLQNSPVLFTIQRPDGVRILRTVLTNDSGIAKTDLSLLPFEGPIIGTWQVLANATISNEEVKDAFDFQCASQSARIDVFSLKNGVPSISFLPNDTVVLEAQLSYRNASVAGSPVIFEIIAPNGTEFSSQTAVTDSHGIANVTFQFPSLSDTSSNVSSRIWQVLASSQIYNQTVYAGTSFGWFIVTPEIDLFTQKGGLGPGAPGGNFVLNETVVLYAEVRDEFNKTVLNPSIGFSVRAPDGTKFLVAAPSANASGIASYTFRIPPVPSDGGTSFVGTYQAYAAARYEGVVLSDTLTFVVSQP